jgi:hypothetical protein
VAFPRKRRYSVPSAVVVIFALAGCSSEPVANMPKSEITRYVLDLSGSNDARDQYDRLKPDIYEELMRDSLGNPFSKKPKGPVDLSITFIVGSASQARAELITNAQFGKNLYNDMTDVYGRSPAQVELDWPLVIAADQKALDLRFSTDSVCIEQIAPIMEVNLGKDISQEIAEKICKRSKEISDKIEIGIPAAIKKGSGSDVFGALREIETWAAKIREKVKKPNIRVVFASDMVHSTNGQRDLFGVGGILTNKIDRNEICSIAYRQAELSSLKLSDIEMQIIGRGNSRGISADEGEALAIFWTCFAEKSSIELLTVTDGRS